MSEPAMGKAQRSGWANSNAPVTAVTQAGLHIVLQAPTSHAPVTELSMISQQE